MLFDLHGMDERLRTHRDGLPAADFSVFYHLISIDRNRDIMLKVALSENDLHLPTFTKLFPNANWYERETWEMFGITFDGHPNLRRIMMPPTWEGHPLRKDYPARATEFDPFELTKAKQDLEMEALTFKPEEWGMKRGTDNEDFMFLNLGPNHPSAHGAFRIILQLDGEEIVDCVPDIGYHHRGAEKMGERQSWHSYIPYTDRIEYLGGCVNEMPYVLAVEKLAGITVPDRVNVIRVMLSEAVPHQQPPAVYLDLYSGRRRDDAGLLRLYRSAENLRSGGSDYRVPYAPGVVPHRRRRARSAAWLGSPAA